jgi:TonB family protein
LVEPANISEIALPERWGMPLQEPSLRRRVARAGIGSVAVHIFLGFVAMSLPASMPRNFVAENPPDVRKAIPLVAPRPKEYEPTQKAPNKEKPTRELDVRSAVEAPQRQAPRFLPPAPPPGPVAQQQAPVPAPVPAEPPMIEVAQTPPPPITTTTPAQQPPKPPDSKPKIAFESVGAYTQKPADQRTIPSPPRQSVEEAARQAIRQGGGGVMVGDAGADQEYLPSLRQAPSPGRPASNLQLLSDPAGVDFKPYMIQVLMAVRRNWLAVIPESARLGRRGRVLIQIIIDRYGAVPKLVIASSSGMEAFDRAAVAGVSASYPFPPLPADYKGDQIRLQLAFTYNGSTGQLR